MLGDGLEAPAVLEPGRPGRCAFDSATRRRSPGASLRQEEAEGVTCGCPPGPQLEVCRSRLPPTPPALGILSESEAAKRTDKSEPLRFIGSYTSAADLRRGQSNGWLKASCG